MAELVTRVDRQLGSSRFSEPSAGLERTSIEVSYRIDSKIERTLGPGGSEISVLLHGSRADGSAIPFSDVDLIVLIWESGVATVDRCVSTLKALERLVRYTVAVDPLQHHVPYVLFERDDLDATWNWAEFPPLVLENLHYLGGHRPPPWVVSETGDMRDQARKQLAHILSLIGESTTVNQAIVRPYQLKELVSHVCLIPVLWCQARGLRVAKRESFELELPPAMTAVVAAASAVRSEWEWRGLTQARALRRAASFSNGAGLVRHAIRYSLTDSLTDRGLLLIKLLRRHASDLYEESGVAL
jgi:predicted nucleotidyltransferase